MDDGLMTNLPYLDPLGLCSKGEPSRHQTQDYEYKHPENLPPSPHLSVSLSLCFSLCPPPQESDTLPTGKSHRRYTLVPCLPPCLLENYANPETEAAKLRYPTQQIEPTFSPVCLLNHSTGRAGKLPQGMQLLLRWRAWECEGRRVEQSEREGERSCNCDA
jgi:hypothetical protein